MNKKFTDAQINAHLQVIETWDFKVSRSEVRDVVLIAKQLRAERDEARAQMENREIHPAEC